MLLEPVFGNFGAFYIGGVVASGITYSFVTDPADDAGHHIVKSRKSRFEYSMYNHPPFDLVHLDQGEDDVFLTPEEEAEIELRVTEEIDRESGAETAPAPLAAPQPSPKEERQRESLLDMVPSGGATEERSYVTAAVFDYFAGAPERRPGGRAESINDIDDIYALVLGGQG